MPYAAGYSRTARPPAVATSVADPPVWAGPATEVLACAAGAVGAETAAFVLSEPGGGPGTVGAVWRADGRPTDWIRVVRGADPRHLHEALGWPNGASVDLGRTTPAWFVADGPELDTAAATLLGPMLGAALDHARALGELRAEVDRERRSVETRTDLVSVVSHELRTPLASIIGALQTLQRLNLAPQGSDAGRIVDSAARRAERLRALVDDLLVAVHPGRAARLRAVRTIDLGSLADEAVATVPGATDRALVAIRPTGAAAELDPERVMRVLVNLVDNAVRHGGGAIEVVIVREPDTVRIEVADHGPGLPPDVAAAIGGGASGRLQPIGSGLGLAITRALVAALDGRIEAAMTPGGGATVRVFVPATAVDPPEAAAPIA